MDIRSAALKLAADLKAQFLSDAGGLIPTAEEDSLLTWAAETLAAGTVLAGNADTREQVAKAKAVLLDLAAAKAVAAEQHVNALIESAVAKAAPLILAALMAA